LRRIIQTSIFILIISLCIAPASFAQKVAVASTTLAGAIAKAAGAEEVRILAPPEVNHPPEYEVKPSDLMKLHGATIAVYGGYEKMVPRLAETSGSQGVIPVPIDTRTSPESLMEQARKIAKVLHTEQEELAWESRFKERLSELRGRLRTFSGKRAVVHRMAEPFARFAELQIVKLLAPGELTPKTVGESIALKPDVVIDILHLPLAGVIAENAKCPYVRIINFPGVDGTKTLEDIFEYNVMQLLKAQRKDG
jgi:zinc transport system substrate-binding protein